MLATRKAAENSGEIVCVMSEYFFVLFLIERHWKYFIGMLAFLVPAVARQTSPILLLVIFVIFLLNQKDLKKSLTVISLSALAVVLAGLYLLTFSSVTSHGSIFSVMPGEMPAFIWKRFFYYGTILTSGITGIILVFIFTGGVFQYLFTKIYKRPIFQEHRWMIPFISSIFTVFVFLFPKTFVIFWLTAVLIFLFIVDDDLRLPLGWAGASILSFLAVSFYHNGYLLEAGFPLSIALGVICIRLFQPLYDEFRERYNTLPKKILVSGLVMVALVGMVAFILDIQIPYIAQKIQMVKISVDSNNNFKHLMKYLEKEMLEGAKLYELTEESLGITLFERRNFTLIDRAKRVKVMSIKDTKVMFRVIGRDDLVLVPIAEIDSLSMKSAYLLALNKYERKIVEKKYLVTPIKLFERSTESAAIYRFQNDQ